MKRLLMAALASVSLVSVSPILEEVGPSTAPTAEAACAYHHWSANVERWHSTAISTGWSQCQWYHLSCIIYRESRGNPYAFNRYDPHGGSLGLTQLNGIHWPWMMRAGLISYPWQLTSAWRNLRAAKALFNRAGWSPWGWCG